MRLDIAMLWVADLREGKFNQAQGRLWRPIGRPDIGDAGRLSGMCCLGVLCELYRQHTGNGYWVYNPDDTGAKFHTNEHDASSVELPPAVQAWAGMQSPNGALGDAGADASSTLAYKNDHGTGFSEIADLIEANVEKL